MPGDGRRGKPKAGFPQRPPPLEIANYAIPTFPPPRAVVFVFIPKTQKGNPAAVASLPPSGSLFDENMLSGNEKTGT